MGPVRHVRRYRPRFGQNLACHGFPSGGGLSADRRAAGTRRGCVVLCVTVRLRGDKGDESYKMLLTYLFYIDLLRYSHRESTRRNPQLASPTKTYKALAMGTICPFVGPATDNQGA